MAHQPDPPALHRLFDVESTDGEARLAIRGSLDINTAPMLADEIARIIATKSPKVTIDLSALDLIDSSGVAVLVRLYRGVRAHGGAVVIRGERGQPLAVLNLLRKVKGEHR